MNKLAVGAAAITTLIASHAMAADMAVKSAPPAPSPAAYNWTGWYVGVNAGASEGNAKTDFNGAPIFFQQVTGAPISQVTPGFAFTDRTYPSGFIGGGQIGYNWQYSPLIVVGLEADIQGALEKDGSNNITNNFTGFTSGGTIGRPTGCIAGGIFGTCTSVTSYTTEIDWFGTVRARLGYVWGNGEVISYVTGGLAYGEVKINGTNNTSGFWQTPCCGGNLSSLQNFSASHVNTGWVLGYGNEGHLPLMPGNWTWRVETLYMELGHLSSTGTGSIVCAVCSPTNLSGGQWTTNTHFTDWILRGGLNYRF